MPSRGGRGGGAGRGPRAPQTREVTISKALSFVLRHGAQAERIHLDEGGWANVEDILAWHKLRSLKVTFAELQAIVASNEKQRFTLIPNPNPASPPTSPNSTSKQPTTDSPSGYLIRAAQGHSLSNISSEALLAPILAADADCPTLVVHGTYEKSWTQILQSGGLKPMSRKHMHFARDVLPPLAPLNKDSQIRPKTVSPGKDTGANEIISGMRTGATVLVWVDVKGSMAEGMKWWRAANGVVLTEGLDGGVGLEWVVWVEKRGVGEVLWGDRERGARMREEGAREVGKVDGADVDALEKGMDGLRVDRDVVAAGAGKEAEARKKDEAVPLKDDWDA